MRIIAIVLAGMVCFSQAVHGHDNHPGMFIDTSDLEFSKSRFEQADRRQAYDRLILQANEQLKLPRYSVVTQGDPGHVYKSQSAYCGFKRPPHCRDGVINPNADRGDYRALVKMRKAVTRLALAYHYTGERKYADKAIEFIHGWTLDQDTYMEPTVIGGIKVELYTTLPGVFYAADMLWDYPGWDAGKKHRFSNWVRTLVEDAISQKSKINNFANWRLVLVASGAVLLHDDTMLAYAFRQWQRLIGIQIDERGALPSELKRNRSLFYSNFAINAMVLTAEIAKRRGVDLYGYRHQGRGLKTVIDYHLPFFSKPADWPARETSQVTNFGYFELLYNHYRDPAYLKFVQSQKRPLRGIRVLEPVTLTHGDLPERAIKELAGFLLHPTNASTGENQAVEFFALASGREPMHYQWRKNNHPIAGATLSTLRLPKVTMEDNGAIFDCVVSNDQGRAISRRAALAVIPDTDRPEIEVVEALSNNSIQLVFSEPVEASSVAEVRNYVMDRGIEVLGARLAGDRRARLRVSPMSMTARYYLDVKNIMDRAKTPNTMEPQQETFLVYPKEQFENGSGFNWFVDKNHWGIVEDEGDMSLFIHTSDYEAHGDVPGEYALLPGWYGEFLFSGWAKINENMELNTHADFVVLFGYIDDRNYYYMSFSDKVWDTALVRIKAGHKKVLATAKTDLINESTYQRFEVVRGKEDINVKLDGETLLSVRDDSFQAGYVGVGSYNDSVYFDDIGVLNIGPPPKPPTLLDSFVFRNMGVYGVVLLLVTMMIVAVLLERMRARRL